MMIRRLISRVILDLLLLGTYAIGAKAAVQSVPPNWALDRIDQRSGPLDASYGYTTTGQGVHIYVVDSGINRYHNEFSGRVVIDKDWLDPVWGDASDCNGHGTAVAGIAAGTLYGVAKQAILHVHRVWGCTASSDDQGDAEELHRFTQALSWIWANHQSPAVVNLSYSKRWPSDDCEDWRYTNTSYPFACSDFRNAVATLVASGVPVVASAGNAAGPSDSICSPNSGCDPYFGCSCSRWNLQYNLPARAHTSVIVVGAASYGSQPTGLDHRVQSTKYAVDVYAPGWQLLTASKESATATQTFNYTSAATAVVTGVVARYLQSHPSATPAQVRSWILGNGTYGTIDHVPTGDQHYLYMSPLE